MSALPSASIDKTSWTGVALIVVAFCFPAAAAGKRAQLRLEQTRQSSASTGPAPCSRSPKQWLRSSSLANAVVCV